MNDIISKLGNSLIQYGKYNDRIYLMKLSKDDFPDIIDIMSQLAQTSNFSKIIARVPLWAKKNFILKGYREEAYIPNLYSGIEDACFLSKYLNEKREMDENIGLIKDIVTTAAEKKVGTSNYNVETKYKLSILSANDCVEMAQVYERVFQTYPFPIQDPDYLADTMQKDVVYFGIRENGKLLAISSCEMDIEGKNVEMTDFATLPEYRSNGFASFLLLKMDEEMRKRGIITAYTIARAISYGINRTFAKHSYIYAGTLINNTNISGGFESMNIWYKAL